jgi:hypothetical protein
MPGKHAPDSPRSFYVSLARAGGAALGALALMIIAVVILVSRGNGTSPNGLPVVSGPTSSTLRSPSPHASTGSPTPRALAPNQVTLDVRNGTKRNGLGRTASKAFENEGYNVIKVGNITASAKSTILYQPGHRNEALAFQQTFPQFTVLKESRSTGGAILRIVIGADYP